MTWRRRRSWAAAFVLPSPQYTRTRAASSSCRMAVASRRAQVRTMDRGPARDTRADECRGAIVRVRWIAHWSLRGCNEQSYDHG